MVIVHVKLFRYMVRNNTLRYVDVVQDIVKSYNNTVHRSLGRAPSEVTASNQDEVRLDQYLLNPYKHHNQRFKYKVGDQVRITYIREQFDREYGMRWAPEVHIITQRFKRDGLVVYKIKDWSGEKIEGTFYQPELQKVRVSDDDTFRIEKVIEKRVKDGRPESYVQWLRWPKKYNTWIPDERVVDI